MQIIKKTNKKPCGKFHCSTSFFFQNTKFHLSEQIKNFLLRPSRFMSLFFAWFIHWFLLLLSIKDHKLSIYDYILWNGLLRSNKQLIFSTEVIVYSCVYKCVIRCPSVVSFISLMQIRLKNTFLTGYWLMFLMPKFTTKSNFWSVGPSRSAKTHQKKIKRVTCYYPCPTVRDWFCRVNGLVFYKYNRLSFLRN